MTRILVADDDFQIVRLLKHALSFEGYDVLTCDGGAKALEIASREQPDLIILDAMMPWLDGYQVLWHLHNKVETQHIPTIMLTARSSRRDQSYGISLGARDYIFKPFSIEHFVKKVGNLLGRGGAVPTTSQ